MTTLTPLMPRQSVPPLTVPVVGGASWTLSDQTPERFTMVAFYRGLHCPICSRYLGDLEARLPEFAKLGTTAIAISSDTSERAQASKEKWNLKNLPVGYGLSLDDARKWGLYISSGRGKTSIGIEEPALFSEPALYIVRADGTLYFGSVQTMPFARPSFQELLGSLDFAIQRNYPARGEVIDHRG